ncbi:MAG: DUF2255 family protein [Stackebrandtia sp.]
MLNSNASEAPRNWSRDHRVPTTRCATRSVTMWMVRVGDDRYVHSVKRRNGPWFRGAAARDQGRIRAGSVDKEVRIGHPTDDGRDPTGTDDALHETTVTRLAM